MATAFTPADNNFYIVIEKIGETLAAFANLDEAIQYIATRDQSIWHFELVAVGRNGESPTVDGKHVYHVIDNDIEVMHNLYLDKLDGYPYVMAGEPFHYDKHHTTSYNKCWGWIIADSIESVQSFIDACMAN